MNLPIFNQLFNDQSTYITFSRALLDLDRAKNMGTEYYYSRMVALNLPEYKEPDFFIDLNEVGISSDNPNITLPKLFQYYMENIIRQDVANNHIVELAFWKALNKCGLSYAEIFDTITFVNKVYTQNFILVENNNGWAEVIGSIPNKSQELNLSFVTTDIPSVIACDDMDLCMFDNGEKEFLFDNKQVIDFNNISYTDIDDQELKFNCLLFFYKDSDGVDKLHGINFINPFDNQLTHYVLPEYIQKSNDARSVGYNFKLNLKTVNNELTQLNVYEHNADMLHWNTYFETLTSLNSLLNG